MPLARESRMPAPSILSRPRYAPFELMPAARSHLVIAESVENLPELPPRSDMDTPVELWTIVANSGASGVEHPSQSIMVQRFRSHAHLSDRLGHRLEHESIGLHLYAIGTEAFIWDIAKLARLFGMDRDEYHLSHQGSEKRRVYCVHCRSMNENVRTNIAICGGCGAHLQVRDHFSKRLGAFMGVQADAECPGELPQIEEMYP